jgi:Zn-dependent protease with chaperone function
VLLAAGVLAVCLLLLAVLAPARLAAASWPARSPALAVLLWQALGLTVGLVALQIAFTLALAPAGATHAAALRALLAGSAEVPVWAGIAFGAGALLLLRLLQVLLALVVDTLRLRRDNRALVDLVATRNPLLAGTLVVDHPVPLAYCLPGLRPRVVLTRGVLEELRVDELRAVLAHEAAHVAQRHDLVVLPFAALAATLPASQRVRTAQEEVALLVEMLADDHAVRGHARDALARALYKVGTGAVPTGGLGAGGSVLLRARRLLHPAPPLPLTGRLAALAATVAVLAVPPLGMLLPLVT